MWYYIKDNKKIGPVTSERLLALHKCNIIADDTKVWNKTENWDSWKEFSDCSTKVMDKRRNHRYIPGNFFGLEKRMHFLRAFLFCTIVVFGVSIYYTLENYNYLKLFLDGAINPSEDNFKVEIATVSGIYSFVNIMVNIMLAITFYIFIKWIKHAYLTCYSFSKPFQTIFPSTGGYHWFIFQPFKMLRRIYICACESSKNHFTISDKIFLTTTQLITIIYVGIFLVNNFLLKKSQMDLSDAQNFYYYLIYSSCVGICLMIFLMMYVTKVYNFLKKKMYHR